MLDVAFHMHTRSLMQPILLPDTCSCMQGVEGGQSLKAVGLRVFERIFCEDMSCDISEMPIQPLEQRIMHDDAVTLADCNRIVVILRQLSRHD
jgi:hypothetical protein